jgi:hypothetical protein
MEHSHQTIDLSFSDNFLSKEEHEIIYDYCIKNGSYTFGERDHGDSVPCGFVHQIPETHLVYKILDNILRERVEFIRDMKLSRMYINCFAPRENGYFHTDGNFITFLYYPNLEQYDIDEGGETKFLVNDNIQGILPIPNRMVIFDGNIKHSATGFRNHHRFTVAIKYKYSS